MRRASLATRSIVVDVIEVLEEIGGTSFTKPCWKNKDG